MIIDTRRLGDLANVFNGKTPSKMEQRSSGHPVLKIKDVSEIGDFRGQFNSFVEPLMAAKYSSRLIRPGDSLILNAAHNSDYVASKLFLAGKEVSGVLPTGEWLLMRPTSTHLLPEYLHYWLRSEDTRKHIRFLVKGIHLYPKDVAELLIPLPQISEQYRLVDILSRAEGIVRLRREAQKKTQELIPALFLDMFGDPATNPKGWNITNIGQLVSYTRYGPRFHDRDYSQEGAHILRTTDIAFDGELHWVNAPTLAVNQEELAKYSLKSGTILITRTGATIGKTTVFTGATRPCIAGAYLIEIGVDDTVLPDYVLHFFLSGFGQQKLTQGSRAVAQPNINVPTIKAIPIPLPPIQIQRSFVDHLKKIRSIQSQQSIALGKAEATFQSLLHRAFSGQL